MIYTLMIVAILIASYFLGTQAERASKLKWGDEHRYFNSLVGLIAYLICLAFTVLMLVVS